MSFAPRKYQINHLNFKPYLSEREVDSAIKKIAEDINKDYKERTPVFLITLKGAMFFGVKLLQNIELDCKVEVIAAKSYGSNMHSCGKVEVQESSINLKEQDVIIVEDIIDTGYTIDKLLKTIQKHDPRTVAVASLVAKPEKFCVDININYLGFSVPPNFIIGSGMDYDERGRNLSGIYILEND